MIFRIVYVWLLSLWGLGITALPSLASLGISEFKRQHLLQDVVTWDAKSLMINGERLMIFSGEFHPFRLPVPNLWLDIFQKIKAIGFNTVSFYVDWALVEGKQGDFSAEGVFDLEPFFEAAKEAGIYLIARPGPYINAESSGGGFPGWLQRIKGHLRTVDPEFQRAQEGYINKIGAIVAKAQITSGGPVILVQPENEYSHPKTGTSLDPEYMQQVEDFYRKSGIVVPLISNDGFNYGNFVPGSGVGAVDIYGHDSYPLGFDCSQPLNWTGDYFPLNFSVLHEKQSPSTPYTIAEFQGGSFDPWGGSGGDSCAMFLNAEFERVFNKNDFSFGVKILNLYMLYGGTNWGNLGFSISYTSYDYGAAIAEDRTLTREKYSELKLQANFLKVSPAYLLADVHNVTNSTYTDTPAISVTRLSTNTTSFWVVRHSDYTSFAATEYTSFAATEYTLTLPTSAGVLAIPQTGGSLLLNGRDSKMLVTDYPVGSFHLLYSTAEIFTWKVNDRNTVLILYGGRGETHEAAFSGTAQLDILDGPSAATKTEGNTTTIHWQTSTTRTIVKLGALYVYLLDRISAYDYWVLDLPDGNGKGSYSTSESVIVKAGYLLRTAQIQGQTLVLTGDVNRTTPFEIISAPEEVLSVSFNGQRLSCGRHPSTGLLTASVDYKSPKPSLPDLATLDWKYVDSLPEIGASYDDSRWTSASNSYTNNSVVRNLTTPTSLYSSDYGYHTGSLLYRGKFTANGYETAFSIVTQGGSAYGASVWLDDVFLGSWPGMPGKTNHTQNLTFPQLPPGGEHIFTVLVDHMGNEENGAITADTMKTPRGVLDYSLDGNHAAKDITWKLTGNLGGEDYFDRTRGPLNEGGMYAERQGWHLPSPPEKVFVPGSPLQGVSKPGIAFYTASFALDLPRGYDIPLAFVLGNSSTTAGASQNHRVQLYINGYQFGKYVNNVGPQTAFPVPEGILNYHGINWIAISLWAMDANGAHLTEFKLEVTNRTVPIQTGYKSVDLSPMPAWKKRNGAY